MKQHFVTFYSPGTFVSEETTKPISEWDIETAIEMSKDIVERYDATPYAFRFITRERSENDLDSHVSEQSSLYYLGGDVFTLEQIEARNNPDDRILIENMKANHWSKVVENRNSWLTVQPLLEGEVVLK